MILTESIQYKETMHNIKKFQDWLIENAQLNKTSIDNPGGFIYSPIGEDDDNKPSNYMFFHNLERIQELTSMILGMDRKKIDEMLNDDHDWANGHVSTAKTNLDHVFEFFNGTLKESVNEGEKFNRQYDMETDWWDAWEKENESDFEIEKDEFQKSYTVKKGEDTIFIYDYRRNRVFTNEKPEMFVLKGEKPKEDKKEDEENTDSAPTKNDDLGT